MMPRQMLVRTGWCVAGGLAVLWAALWPAQAATHALLAGVTRYDHLPAEKQLRAPGNDVARMRDALAGWGMDGAAMTVLADDLPGAKARPTFKAITAELDRLGRPGTVAAGDWVVIYLSGHGATATDSAGLQMSGLNSLFLPADAMLDAGGGPPKNALIDTRIGEAITRIRAQGAHVWFINDSCHSGDSVRAELRQDVRDKSVTVAGRTKPGSRPRPLAASIPAGSAPGLAAPTGRLVAFYAAQVTEAAREFLDEGEWVSAFTLALTRAMRAGDTRDARSLASRAILGVRALRPRGIFQTPYADDDLADGLNLLGGQAAATRSRVEGMGDTLLAGVLDGFDTGTEIEVFASAAAGAPVAAARIAHGGLSRSTVSVLSGALPGSGWFAQLVTPAREGRLTIAVDPNAPASMTAGLSAIVTEATGPAIGLQSAPAEAADVLVSADRDGLRIVPRKALLGIAETVAIPAPALDDTARRAAVTALLRLDFLRRMERAEALASGLPGAMRLQIRTSFRRFAGTSAATCAAPPAAAMAEPLTSATALRRCDAVEAEIRNQSDKPRHVQVLAIHADGTVQTIAPRCGGRASLKLEPGQATAGRQRASAESALPVVWFLIPKPRLAGLGRMAVQVLTFPLDGATAAPDPCQFERFNGTVTTATRGALEFEDDTRSAARPGEILMQSRILEWAAQ